MQGKVAVCSLLTRNSTYQIALGLDQHREEPSIDNASSNLTKRLYREEV